eukprot:752279-Hanusia_phi.AAC.1
MYKHQEVAAASSSRRPRVPAATYIARRNERTAVLAKGEFLYTQLSSRLGLCHSGSAPLRKHT